MNILITIGIFIFIISLIGGLLTVIGELFNEIGEFLNNFWSDISSSIEDYGQPCGIIISIILSASFIIFCLIIGEDHSLYNSFYRENDAIRSSTKLLFIIVPIIIVFLFSFLEVGQTISVWIISIILTLTVLSLVIGLLSLVIYKTYGWIMA